MPAPSSATSSTICSPSGRASTEDSLPDGRYRLSPRFAVSWFATTCAMRSASAREQEPRWGTRHIESVPCSSIEGPAHLDGVKGRSRRQRDLDGRTAPWRRSPSHDARTRRAGRSAQAAVARFDLPLDDDSARAWSARPRRRIWCSGSHDRRQRVARSSCTEHRQKLVLRPASLVGGVARRLLGRHVDGHGDGSLDGAVLAPDGRGLDMNPALCPTTGA